MVAAPGDSRPGAQMGSREMSRSLLRVIQETYLHDRVLKPESDSRGAGKATIQAMALWVWVVVALRTGELVACLVPEKQNLEERALHNGSQGCPPLQRLGQEA